MAKYVDGFVLMVPKKNMTAYKKMAQDAGKIWRKYGALDYKECVIDDPKPQHITLTFSKLTKAKPSEVVLFSYIVYKSRKHRDQVNTKVMKEMERLYPDYKDKPMPFDMKRMAYAGFETIVDL